MQLDRNSHVLCELGKYSKPDLLVIWWWRSESLLHAMKYQKPFLAVVCICRNGAVSKQDRFRSNASGFHKQIFCIWTRAYLKAIMLVVATCLSDLGWYLSFVCQVRWGASAYRVCAWPNDVRLRTSFGSFCPTNGLHDPRWMLLTSKRREVNGCERYRRHHWGMITGLEGGLLTFICKMFAVEILTRSYLTNKSILSAFQNLTSEFCKCFESWNLEVPWLCMISLAARLSYVVVFFFSLPLVIPPSIWNYLHSETYLFQHVSLKEDLSFCLIAWVRLSPSPTNLLLKIH